MQQSLRMVRILSFLGSKSYAETEVKWHEITHPNLIQIIGFEKIQNVMQMPLSNLLAEQY
jgi:hypothetical protein